MKKDGIYIGIDPDVEKSGVSVLKIEDKMVQGVDVASHTFPEVLATIQATQDASLVVGLPLIVVVEAGWLNKSNWHIGRYASIAKASKMGEAIGRNQQVGHDIVEWCKYKGIEVVEQQPLRKTWQGQDHKITHDELTYFVPLKKKKTNQEERDACLLAWCFANLPVRIRVKR